MEECSICGCYASLIARRRPAGDAPIVLAGCPRPATRLNSSHTATGVARRRAWGEESAAEGAFLHAVPLKVCQSCYVGRAQLVDHILGVLEEVHMILFVGDKLLEEVL